MTHTRQATSPQMLMLRYWHVQHEFAAWPSWLAPLQGRRRRSDVPIEVLPGLRLSRRKGASRSNRAVPNWWNVHRRIRGRNRRRGRRRCGARGIPKREPKPRSDSEQSPTPAMSEHYVLTLMHESEGRACVIADALRLTSTLRSWGMVEPTGRDTEGRRVGTH